MTMIIIDCDMASTLAKVNVNKDAALSKTYPIGTAGAQEDFTGFLDACGVSGPPPDEEDG